MKKRVKKKAQKKENSVKLKPAKFALAAGIVVSASVLLTTLVAMSGMFGSFPVVTSIISDIYGSIGYSVTPLGSVLGAAFSFVDSFIMAFVFAWLYNKFL